MHNVMVATEGQAALISALNAAEVPSRATGVSASEAKSALRVLVDSDGYFLFVARLANNWSHDPSSPEYESAMNDAIVELLEKIDETHLDIAELENVIDELESDPEVPIMTTSGDQYSYGDIDQLREKINALHEIADALDATRLYCQQQLESVVPPATEEGDYPLLDGAETPVPPSARGGLEGGDGGNLWDTTGLNEGVVAKLNRLRQDLEQFKALSAFSHDATDGNELTKRYEEPMLERLNDLRNGLGLEQYQRIERELCMSLYMAYRRHYLSEVEMVEIQGRNPDWRTFFESQIMVRMRNLVERATRVRVLDVDKVDKTIKEAVKQLTENGGVAQSAREALRAELSKINPQLANLSESDLKWAIDVTEIQLNYVARKFLHISFQHVAPSALGENKREYVGVTPDTNYPIVFVQDYLMRDGLRSPDFGDTTNVVTERNHMSELRPFSSRNGDVSAAEYEKSDRTVHGDIFRTLDRWALGRAKLYQPNGTEITTRNIHNAQEQIVDALHDRFFKIEAAAGLSESRYTKTDIRLALRHWECATFHQSSRAVTSAFGADLIYYLHKFADYNDLYTEAGTLNWETLVTHLLYTVIDPATGEKLNPWEYILGTMDIQSERRSVVNKAIRKMTKSGDVRTVAVKLKQDPLKAFLDENPTSNIARKRVENRRRTHGFKTYKFLLKPLMTRINVANGPIWAERWKPDGSLERYYIQLKWNEKTSKYDEIEVPTPDLATDETELFTMMPLLGTVFLRDKHGVPLRFAAPGKPWGGRPVSFLDLQDEWGEVCYEQLPFNQEAVNIAVVLDSLKKNGTTFLTDFLKSPAFVSTMSDPAKVAEFKNNAKYVLMHQPNGGSMVAAEISKYDPEWENFEKSFMNMLIIMLLLAKLLAEIGQRTDKGVFSEKEIRNILDNLIQGSGAIDDDAAEALAAAAFEIQKWEIRFMAVTAQMTERLKQRFMRTAGGSN